VESGGILSDKTEVEVVVVRRRENIPTYDSMMNPLLQALRELGGSGTIQEIDNRVIEILNLSDEQLSVVHDPERSQQTEVEYRLAWTRTYLRKYGLLENSGRGVWALTKSGAETDRVDPAVVKRQVKEADRASGRSATSPSRADEIPAPGETVHETWQSELLKIIRSMSPSAFERLAQRILREAGFTQVEVTGRSGDGGIDGKGIMRLGDMLSFRVIFQCKRYSGPVVPAHVRDFRGAMVGRADKGLLITTGTFTRDAVKEATRDGATEIDLIDGEQLGALLKKLELGVKTEMVEEVTIERAWFESF